MIPFVIGGVALAATGYGIMKYLEDDDNREKLQDSLIRGYDNIDNFQEKGLDLIDSLEEKTDQFFGCKDQKSTEALFLKLDENGCQPTENESLGQYNIAKIELLNTTFIELTTALKEIDNLPESIHTVEPLEFAQTIYPFDTISVELKSDFEKHAQILQDTKKYIDSHLDTLDTIIISNIDFKNYSDEDKKLIQNLIAVFKLIEHITYTKMTNDRVSISRGAKRAFGKLKQLIS